MRKAVPPKPKDVKKIPINPVVTEWMKETGHKAMHDSATHRSYALPPAANESHGGPRFVKKYPVASPTEYVQFESLLSSLIGVVSPVSDLRHSPRVLLPLDYTSSEASFALVRPLGQSTLAQQLSTLGLKRSFTKDDAWLIFSDMAEAVRDIQAVGLAHLAVKPSNIILCGDAYKLADLVFNDYVLGSLKAEESKRKAELAQVFPHMGGKTDHTVVVFSKTGNEYVHARDIGRRLANKEKPVVKGHTGDFTIIESKLN